MSNFLKLCITLCIGILIGLFIYYKKIPHKLRDAFTSSPDFNWSIGIYSGETPFDLTPINSKQPVLTKDDVTDTDADFVADPYCFIYKEKPYMFLEVLNNKTNQGDIAFATSDDFKEWKYQKIVLDEKFHLSYPCVFEDNGTIYMIPESHEDLSVRLYKATDFPHKWEFQKNLLYGFHWVDPNVVKHNGKYWLFVSNLTRDNMHIFSADSLTGGWVPHKLNPVIAHNTTLARNGGRMITYNNKLYRYAQDCGPYYGYQLLAMEITELTDSTYSETPHVNNPILTPSAKDNTWNRTCMHHADPHFFNGKWFVSVDGKGNAK